MNRLWNWPRVWLSVVGLVSACQQAPPAEILVQVKGVAYDFSSQSPVVILAENEGQRQLPIWIGPAEAQAIAMRLEGMTPPRPLTHDLLQRLLQESGAEVEKVVVTALKDGVYFAEIHIKGKRGSVKVDSRPSDAIALALRCERPIYVARTLMEEQSQRGGVQASSPELRIRAGITVQNLTPELAQFFGLEGVAGVIVTAAESRTGLRSGDCIVSVEGTAIRNVDEFSQAMERTKGQRKIHLVVHRGRDKIELVVPVQDS
ncbi:MAG: hypothetical protein KatS3mg077_1412 [Candidatus Binatia bacterium]|nr:MAG: hypothetical protein KatS3mg077_1412 [Candidatus Binatia bacterium]